MVRGQAGPKVVAKSVGMSFAWEELALQVAAKFGPRPIGIPCPTALFVLEFGKAHVAVVQVADAVPHAGGFVPLQFRFLIFTKRTYDLLGDPFALSDRYPANWSAAGELAVLEWPEEYLPKRRVEDVLALLKAGDMPWLLGAAQALLDGGSLLWIADAPQNEVFRNLWQLLPERTRCDLRPATFAFAGELGFNVWAMPKAPEPWPERTLSVDQARDYPEGRYELALQVAAEGGNQADLDRLFARPSGKETLRLAASLVAFAVIVALIGKFLL